jgi:addiction module HigA family antidote
MTKRLKPLHPGEILREEFLTPLGLSMNKLALDLRVPVTRIGEIVHQRRAITPETALRLAQYFRTSPEFWMNLQTRYDLERAEDRLLPSVRRDVRPHAAPKRARLPRRRASRAAASD